MRGAEGHDLAIVDGGIWIADCGNKLSLSATRTPYVEPPELEGQVLLVDADGATQRRIGCWHDGPFSPAGVTPDQRGRDIWIADGYRSHRIDLVADGDSIVLTIHGVGRASTCTTSTASSFAAKAKTISWRDSAMATQGLWRDDDGGGGLMTYRSATKLSFTPNYAELSEDQRLSEQVAAYEIVARSPRSSRTSRSRRAVRMSSTASERSRSRRCSSSKSRQQPPRADNALVTSFGRPSSRRGVAEEGVAGHPASPWGPARVDTD